MIKIMLFDVDGVLVNGELFSRHLARDHGITPDTTSPFFTGPFFECLVGQADLKQILPSYVQEWGWQHSIDDFLSYWFSTYSMNEPLLHIIQQLRQQGIPCYLATNQEQYRTAYILEEMGFAQKFDGIFSSAHVGQVKSQPAFFEHVLRKLNGIAAHEILFWDDSAPNVATARQSGLQAEIYTTFADFTIKMSRYLDQNDATLQ
ncbi:MAG: HAD family hydrolase [Ktedonobacteraceae bacterium]